MRREDVIRLGASLILVALAALVVMMAIEAVGGSTLRKSMLHLGVIVASVLGVIGVCAGWFFWGDGAKARCRRQNEERLKETPSVEQDHSLTNAERRALCAEMDELEEQLRRPTREPPKKP